MPIVDGIIIPNGENDTRAGIGLHLYPGGVRKYGVRLYIELQRAPEVAGNPGTWATIARLEPGPQGYMDQRFIKWIRDSASDRNYFYRARMVAEGLAASAWSAVDEGTPGQFQEGFSLPPVPSYPKIGIEQVENPNDATKVSVTLRATPEHPDTVIKYVVLDDGDPVPSRKDAAWTTYSGIFEVVRSDVTVKKIVAYGRLNAILGNNYIEEIATDRIPVVLNIALAVAPNGDVTAEITTDADSGSVKYLAEKVDYPTKGEVQASGTCSNGRNVTTGTLVTLADGETAFVSVLPYSQTGCTGIEGELSRATITFSTSGNTNFVADAYVHSEGDAARLFVQLASGSASFKWAVQAGSYPAGGTGTCVDATTAQVDVTASVPDWATTYFVTVTPYDAASCAGSAGNLFQFTFRRQWRDELLDDTTGWLKDSGLLAQKKFENDGGEKLALTTSGIGAVGQPASYAPADDNERTFIDKDNKHIPNQTDWGAGAVHASIARYQFSVKYQTDPDATFRKIFALVDLSDGTFWNASTGTGIWIEWGGSSDNQAKIYKRVAGTDTQLGGFMQVAESIVNDYIEFDIIVYDWNPVKFLVGLNGKFQDFSDAANPNLSTGVFMALIVHEDADPLFKNIFGRQEIGPVFAKRFVVGDFGSFIGDSANRDETLAVSGVDPHLTWYETDTDSYFSVRQRASALEFLAENNDQSAAGMWMQVQRTGSAVNSIGLFPGTSADDAVYIQPNASPITERNTVTGEALVVEHGIGLYDNSGAANEKHWLARITSENLQIAAVSDDGATIANAMVFVRGTGATVDFIDFHAPLRWGAAAPASGGDFLIIEDPGGGQYAFEATVGGVALRPAASTGVFRVGTGSNGMDIIVSNRSAPVAECRIGGATSNRFDFQLVTDTGNQSYLFFGGNSGNSFMAGSFLVQALGVGLRGNVTIEPRGAAAGHLLMHNGSSNAGYFFLNRSPIIVSFLNANENITARDVVFLDDASGGWLRADANLASFTEKKVPKLGIATATVTSGNPIAVAVFGNLFNSSFNYANANRGFPLYVPTSPGPPTLTPPSTAGDIVYVVGHVMGVDDVFIQPQYLGKL